MPDDAKKALRNATQKLYDELYERADELKHVRAILAGHEKWLHTFALFLAEYEAVGSDPAPALVAQAYLDRQAAEDDAREARAERDQMRDTLVAWAKAYGKDAPEV
jgi:hypothetical protein